MLIRCEYNNLDHSSTLHLRFPFNLTPTTQLPPIEDVAKEAEVEKKQRRRRFSMSDALGLNSFKRLRSQSRSPTRAPSISSETRRRRFLLRTPFNMASSRRNEKIESVLANPDSKTEGT